MTEKKKRLELYIHIPFCVRKCLYCDFLSFPLTSEDMISSYLAALAREIRKVSPAFRDYVVSTAFIGGGTPSVLTGGQMAFLMDALYEHFDFDAGAEISAECNPGTADADKLKSFRKSGINRLSLGVQSMDEAELSLLGRIHTPQGARQAFWLARETGFSNINLDLMSALPEQSAGDYEKSLREVCALCPEHISAYSLMIEEGTPFGKRYAQDVSKREAGLLPEMLPREETELLMFAMTRQILEENGYARYEISNYAKPGWECRHNLGYWTGAEYLGLGLGSSSYLNNPDFRVRAEFEKPADAGMDTERKSNPGLYPTDDDRTEFEPELYKNSGFIRCKNTEDFSLYIESENPPRALLPLTKADRISERVMLGLRLAKGFSLRVFQEDFSVSFFSLFADASKRHIQAGLLERDGDFLRLTEKGFAVSNYVMSDFLL